MTVEHCICFNFVHMLEFTRVNYDCQYDPGKISWCVSASDENLRPVICQPLPAPLRRRSATTYWSGNPLCCTLTRLPHRSSQECHAIEPVLLSSSANFFCSCAKRSRSR